MSVRRRLLVVARLLAAALACAGLTAMAAPAATQEPSLRLRVIGGLAAPGRYARLEEPFWNSQLPALSDGRYKAEITPFDRAGVPSQDMLRLLQLGVVQFGTAPLSNVAAQDPAVSTPDLAGLNPDMASLRKSVAAFRPFLEARLRERYGIELLALYVYPAQVLFCKQPLSSLNELAGRRVRVSGPSAADFMEALGAIPVVNSFNEMVPSVAHGLADCAVTGGMSGNTIGLHEITGYLHPMALTWGLQLFGANSAVWHALPADLKQLLRRELPKLEAAIWSDAEKETAMGLACNTGASDCRGGRRGKMRIVQPSAEDERRRREIFTSRVLPAWIERCGPSCAQLWHRTLAPVTGFHEDRR